MLRLRLSDLVPAPPPPAPPPAAPTPAPHAAQAMELNSRPASPVASVSATVPGNLLLALGAGPQGGISGGPAPAIYPLNLAGAAWADHAELAATLERELGRLDGLVHCAAHFRSCSRCAPSRVRH